MVAVNTDTLFFGLSLSAFVLVFIPFYWHLKARNTGTCLFMTWIGLACIILSINSFLWKDAISNLAPVWCDISSKLLVGSNAAIASVASCINIRLWLVASDRVRTLERKNVFRIELLLGLGFPILEMIFQFFVQNRRFDIYEGFGCRAVSDNVLLMYILLLAPQFLLGIASTTFFVLASANYRRVYKYMLETQYSPAFHQRTTLSASFLGFLILGGLSIVCSVAYTAFVVYFSATADDTLGSFTLWQSWDLTHRNISAVNVYTEEEWRGDTMTEVLLEANRWIFVGLAYLFFLVFGLTSEVRRRYRRLIGCGGRGESWFEAEKTVVDRGIVHYADRDAENAEMLTNKSESTLIAAAILNAPLAKPLVVDEPTVNEIPKDPFTLDNPYPRHTHDKKPDNKSAEMLTTSAANADIQAEDDDDAVITVSRTRLESMSLLPNDPFAATPLTSLPIAPNASTTSLRLHQPAPEPTYDFPSQAPSSSHDPYRHPSAHGPAHFVSANEENRNSFTTSPPASLTRGRSNSLGSYTVQAKRSSRRRSLSRSLSASATSPPTGPLPDIPPDLPYTPHNFRNFPLDHTIYPNQRFSGSMSTPSLISSYTASSVIAPSEALSYQLSRRRTERRSIAGDHLSDGRAF